MSESYMCMSCKIEMPVTELYTHHMKHQGHYYICMEVVDDNMVSLVDLPVEKMDVDEVKCGDKFGKGCLYNEMDALEFLVKDKVEELKTVKE